MHTVNTSIKPTSEIVAEQNHMQYSRTSPFAVYHLVPINVLNIALSSCLLTEFSAKHTVFNRFVQQGYYYFWQG